MAIIGLIFEILCLATIAVQLTCTIYSIKIWTQTKLKPLLWLSVYSACEFGKSIIGYSMSRMGIHNREFHWYSDPFSITALFIFALTLVHEKKFRKPISISYALAWSLFITLEILQIAIETRQLIMYSQVFQIVTGAFILRDRLKHNEGRKFNEDPWSVIAFVIMSTVSISLLAIGCRHFLNTIDYYDGSNLFFKHVITFLNFLNCISVLFRYVFITIQLKKLKNLTLT